MNDIFLTQESIFASIHSRNKDTHSGQAPFSALLTIICEKYHISVVDVMALTLEQFLWLQDGVIFSLNVQTEE